MPRAVGTECVVDALAESLNRVGATDLKGTSPPPSPCEPTGRYLEVGELGRGGLGIVIEVFDKDLRRPAALKRPHDDKLDAENIARLVKEAQITAQLEHPNVPPVYSLGIDEDGRPFFAMLRFTGRSLAELLELRTIRSEVAAQLTLPRLLRLFLQVCHAVSFAHSRGVLHRDLKPHNILIGDHGEVRVVDWGLATLLRDSSDPSAAPTEAGPRLSLNLVTCDELTRQRDGETVGTPGYAAPEQLCGENDVDQRADVYALGAILYELVANRLPCEGKSATAQIAATIAGKLVPLPEQANVDDALCAIIRKALAHKRQDRYPEVAALLVDLESYLDGRTVTAHSEGVLHRVGRWYLGRTPRTARLRNIDIDLLCWGCFFGGLCIGLRGAEIEWLPDYAPWLLGTAALFALLPGMYSLLRPTRPDDKGAPLNLPPTVSKGRGLVRRWLRQRSARESLRQVPGRDK